MTTRQITILLNQAHRLDHHLELRQDWEDAQARRKAWEADGLNWAAQRRAELLRPV